MPEQNTITRKDLMMAIHRQIGLAQSDSADLLEIVLDTVSERIQNGEVVRITSFGTFRTRSKQRRMARNPKTGEPAEVPAHQTVLFRPSGGLLAQLNSSDPDGDPH